MLGAHSVAAGVPHFGDDLSLAAHEHAAIALDGPRVSRQAVRSRQQDIRVSGTADIKNGTLAYPEKTAGHRATYDGDAALETQAGERRQGGNLACPGNPGE